MTTEIPYIYLRKFINRQPDDVFHVLKNELDWIRHDKVPRSEYYCNDTNKPYSYGSPAFARTYQVQPWHPVILAIREALEDTIYENMDVCFLNYYKDASDHLGWHSDDSPEMDDERSIVTISLGAEREIWFRPNIKETMNVATDRNISVEDFGEFSKKYMEPEKLILHNGSACIMQPGMQDTHQHRIPKASFNCGERISLTFRGFVS